jgi:curved DNA-binding protein CbpA
MSKIEIDFNNLKYNLYVLLNVEPTDEPSKIKKSFMKIIKKFHPDKNSELEEEIYYHIILANQILLDGASRKKYDEFLNGTAESFNEMKSSFSKSIKGIEQFFPTKSSSVHAFNQKKNELNKKHGYTEENSGSVMDRFKKIKEKRETDEIKINKEEFKTTKDFNSKFDVNKQNGGKFEGQIIEHKGAPQELSTYVVGEQYTSLGDIDKLYIEDTVQSSRYSSLDRAFMLQPVLQTNNTKSTEHKIKEYLDETEKYQKFKPTDFSTKKFDEY